MQHRVSGDVGTGGDGKGMLKNKFVTRQTSGVCVCVFVCWILLICCVHDNETHID